MIRTPVDLTRHLPIERKTAALIANAASRYPCTPTLERDNIVLNLKSMIGLLSQSIPRVGRMEIVADGPQEDAASRAMVELLEQLRK